MHIVSVVGARPNFVKIAPIARTIAKKEGIKHTIIHTGQHYDETMSAAFFQTLEIPEPSLNLNVGPGSHGDQTGRIMMKIEPVLQEIQPDWVITVGDVNSTVAASLVSVKLGIKTAHVEAGLRSFDRTMPEEINRLVTDTISDALFVTEQSGLDNLCKEGIPQEKTYFVGNVMIDSLVYLLPQLKQAQSWKEFGLKKGQYILVTLHRPTNVDLEEPLSQLVKALQKLSMSLPVLFPVHPRTRKQLENFGLWSCLMEESNIVSVKPLDYFRFLSLVLGAKLLLTDSGGIQEETTYLGIPCLTLRPNTERPVTLDLGTNQLVKSELSAIMESFNRIDQGNWNKGTIPPLWDGRTAERIIDILIEIM